MISSLLGSRTVKEEVTRRESIRAFYRLSLKIF